MPYDFDRTHELILESAMKNFTTEGFRNASIRNICKDAGLTNGAFYSHFKSKDELFSALIDDCVNNFNNTYNDLCHVEVTSPEDIIKAFKSSYSSIEILIHYIYENRDIFTLILKCSDGSSYENFVDGLIENETMETMVFLEKCKKHMKHPENISERIAGTGSSLVIRSMISAFLDGSRVFTPYYLC